MISSDGVTKIQKAVSVLDVEDGLEIKCPMLKTHRKYLKKGIFPGEHRLQIQTSLAVTGWDVWWFMSYFPGGVKSLILPVRRDEKLITIIKDQMERFNDDLENLVIKLTA